MSVSPTHRTYTPDDLLEITDRPAPDLVNGHLEEREPVGQLASVVALALAVILKDYARNVVPGIVSGADGGFQIFPDDPDKVRFPDVAFTRKERLPGGRPFEGHSTVVPELVVEVVSPNDRSTRLEEKIIDYRAAGVPMLWLVYPSLRFVRVLCPDGSTILKTEHDTLDGGDVLPGFSCPVSALFE